MTPTPMQLVDAGNYQELFIEELNWQAPDHRPVSATTDDGRVLTARNVASHQGIRVWVCDDKPGSNLEAQLDRAISKTTIDRIVIFRNDQDQVWRWPARRHVNGAVTDRLTSHRHRNGQEDPKFAAKVEAIRLPFDTILDAPTVLQKVRHAFDVETQNESKRASKLMATLYASLAAAYPSTTPETQRTHEISVILARLLFLLFGDDTEMWATDAFRNLIQHDTSPDGSDLAKTLTDLFEQLDSPSAPQGRYPGFKHVNGGIFHEPITLPPVGKDFRSAILDACAVDWSDISPAIFGSMFQAVRDAKTRRSLGEHYTSEENILRTLNPLFLDDLRATYMAALDRDTDQKKINSLRQLWRRLSEVRFLDPACGCGNFLIVAYRELRNLELAVMESLAELEGQGQGQETLGGDMVRAITVTLDHFAGIEIDEWPAKIAQTGMFLIDRQCDLKMEASFGRAPERLPIQTEAKIVVSNALTVDWNEIFPATDGVVVAGNPPFLGISQRSAEQTRDLKAVWGDRYHGTLDYVTGWHAKTIDYLRGTKAEWAFVTTNSITQGEATAPLFTPILDEGWRIKFAHRTFPWTSEAPKKAAVHCSIIGFTRTNGTRRLFDYGLDGSLLEERAIDNITPYLTPGADILVTSASQPLNPQLGTVAYGNKPTDDGGFVIEAEQYDEAMADPIAARYVRPYVGAKELLHAYQRHCLWLVDSTEEEREQSPFIKKRVAHVRESRLDSDAASTRAAAKDAHLFRQISQPDTPYLCIPRHSSSSRPYFLSAHFDADVICSDANFLATDADGFSFSILSSAMFMAWQKAVGGRIKSDLRFNKLLTWNTFPLPEVSAEARQQIIDAGHEVLAARRSMGDTSLADIYAPGNIPDELLEAHAQLDRAVDALFRVDSPKSELERQALLLLLYDKARSAALMKKAQRGGRRK